jgi:hypothetical protein
LQQGFDHGLHRTSAEHPGNPIVELKEGLQLGAFDVP